MATVEHRLASENLQRNRCCSNDWSHHNSDAYLSSRPVSRAAYGDGLAIQTQHRGSMNKWLDQSLNSGYETTRPVARAPSCDAQENLARSRDGSMGFVMNVAGNEGYTSARSVPRIRQEAMRFAERDRGAKLTDSGSQTTARNAILQIARVKPEAAANQTRNQGTMGKIMNVNQTTPLSDRPAPRVKPEAEEFAERNRGSMAHLFHMYGHLPLSTRPQARVKPEAQRNASRNRGTMSEVMVM